MLKTKQIILSVSVTILLAATIAANATGPIWKEYLRQQFGEFDTNFGNDSSQLALKSGDEACQSIVLDSVTLLKNNNNVLPLKDGTRINLFGYGATKNGFIHSGGGSSGTTLIDDKNSGSLQYFKTLKEALEIEGFEINNDLYDAYTNFSSYQANLGRGIANVVNPGESFYTKSLMDNAKNYSDTAIFVISRGGSESVECPLNYLELTSEEKIMIQKIKETGFDNVICLLNTGRRMEAGFLDDEAIDGAMFVGITGQSGSLSIARLLKGSMADSDGKIVQISPSGKLSDTYTYSTSEYDPTYVNTFPTISTHGEISYQEGIYIGYKWYETADKEGYFDNVSNEFGDGYKGVVQYPFGYGLSYTTFKWNIKYFTALKSKTFDENTEFVAEVEVTNTGKHRGSDVVELYFTPQYYVQEIEKAEVNLIAFAKTKELDPGEKDTVILKFNAFDLASYDCYDKNDNGHTGYELDRGNYKFSFRTDAHTIASITNAEVTNNLKTTINIDKDPVTNNEIINRFTDDGEHSVYMDVPIDGHTLGKEIVYLSREDFDYTFPKKRPVERYKTTAAKKANKALNDEYDVDVMPTFNADNGLYLTTVNGKKPTNEDLDGRSGNKLTPNEELIFELASDYNSEKWDLMLDQLSKDEIATLVQHGGCIVDKAASIGKPQQAVFDGPSGFHAGDAGSSSQKKGEWTAFPAESLIGCSWNIVTAYTLGKVQGEIGQATNVGGWYAPGLNLHRNPYSGRYFEYFSEDSILVGNLGAEVVRGAKNKNLTAYIKHFAASEEGINPDNVMTWLTEQALRETYLRPFEIAVKKGKANAVMSAFNGIGAVWAGACDALNNKILRNEWGFVGSVISDYSMGRPYMNTEQAIRAGNDFMLDASGATSPIDKTNTTTMNQARLACKNIIYTWVDNYKTAYDYSNGKGVDIVISGGLVSNTPEIIQIVGNVVLIAGMLTCLAFAFVPFNKIFKKGKSE